jgi:nicotinamide riboside transporter PnuC
MGSGGGFIQKRRLATWWLTLIGASFAALSMVIAVLDPRTNAPLGWTGIVITIVVYLLSAWGHYAQVTSPGVPEASGFPWKVVNVVMIVIWLVLLAFELHYVFREQAKTRLNR